MRSTYGDLGSNELCNSSAALPLQRCQDLQSTFPDISGCNVFERRGVIERLEARSEVQLNSERIAVEAGLEVDLVFNREGEGEGGCRQNTLKRHVWKRSCNICAQTKKRTRDFFQIDSTTHDHEREARAWARAGRHTRINPKKLGHGERMRGCRIRI